MVRNGERQQQCADEEVQAHRAQTATPPHRDMTLRGSDVARSLDDSSHGWIIIAGALPNRYPARGSALDAQLPALGDGRVRCMHETRATHCRLWSSGRARKTIARQGWPPIFWLKITRISVIMYRNPRPVRATRGAGR